MIRTFIAIDLSTEIRNNLRLLLGQLKTKGDFPVRWTTVDNIHITLKFLGDVEEKYLPVLHDRLIHTVTTYPQFQLRIGKLGAFPKVDRPRIIWVGCDLDKEGFQLQKTIENVTAESGFPKEDRPFSPHLTIGRVTDAAGLRDYPLLSHLISETKAENLGLQTIKTIRIYRSDLSSAGPKYHVLYEIPLEN